MEENILHEIKKSFPGVRQNISLKKYTTFKIGGPAKYFIVVSNKEDLIKAVRTAQKMRLSFFILGGGSNLLVHDKGFNGLVIKNEAGNFRVDREIIIAESGAILSKIVQASISAGLSGLIEGIGIPGTVGGAVCGNAGWPKGAWAIGNIVKEITVLMPNGKVKKVGKKWLAFRYRNSRLKVTKGLKPVILDVVLEFRKTNKKSLEKKAKEILKLRRQKIPLGFSAGSVFKNPTSESAGFLIERCGLKGKKNGKAQISEKHANFIVNLGNAKAKDVKKLINLTKRKVKNKFGILLDEEIQYVGFKN